MPSLISAGRKHATADCLDKAGLRTSASRRVLAALIGAGALSAVAPAGAADINVANESQLRAAMSSAGSRDVIMFTADITLTSNLPVIRKDMVFYGNNHALSGDGRFRGLFVESGSVLIRELNIRHTKALGGKGGDGNGGGGGGGGAGLGGALFVGARASVSVSHSNLQDNLAQGGDGGGQNGSCYFSFCPSGGGGSYEADGGDAAADLNGKGGAGGGGDGEYFNGGAGEFGGGGGGSGSADSRRGGVGGNGGFGGGGGGSSTGKAGIGGFGGGNGFVRGGGGAGLGGAIFVQQGGKLELVGNLDISGNAAKGGGDGSPAGNGSGAGVFLSGSGTLTLAIGTGRQTIHNTVVDEKGSGISGGTGSWSIEKEGSGVVAIKGSLSGGANIDAGTLEMNASTVSGNITNAATLIFLQTEGDGTYAGNITGTGKLIVSSGVATLTGHNTYTGTTTVRDNGTLLFSADTSLGGAGHDISLITGGAIGLSGATALTSNRALTITGRGGFGGISPAVLTWGGAIGGTGELVVSGGNVTLSGTNNTYTGGTSVTGGLLRIRNEANLGPGSMISLNGGSIGSTDQSMNTTFSRDLVLGANGGGFNVALHPIILNGDISGSGLFVKQGPGTLELKGNNTHSGGTLVSLGVLQIASDDKLGAANSRLTLHDNGNLRASETFASARNVSLTGVGGGILVDADKILTLSGVVSGAALTKLAPGTLVLTNTNSYKETYVYGGTLRGNALSIRGNISFDPNPLNTLPQNVTFDQATNGTFAGNIMHRGSVTKTGAGVLTLAGTNTYSEGTTVSGGTLKGTTSSLQGAILNNASVVFDQGVDGVYAGNMTGSGRLTKQGLASVDLKGTNTVGSTFVNVGTLAVNGTLTSPTIFIEKDATLRGSGTIKGDVSGPGDFKPGNSIGTITVDGNLNMNRGTIEIEINGNGSSDRINVIGAGHTANLAASTLSVVPEAGTYTPNTRYTIVSAPAGGIANFGALTGGVGFLTPSLSYDDTNLYLSMVLPANAFRSAGQTINQQAVGGALDAAAASGNVGGIVTAMANLAPSQGSAALQALSGQPYADFGTVNLRGGQLFMNAIGRQMAVNRGAGLGGAKSVALAEACADTCDAGTGTPTRFGAWLSGIGSTGSVLGDGNAAGLTYTLGGTAFGIDYRLDPRFLVGIAGGYVGGTQWVNGFSGTGNVDALSVALYGSFTEGGFYADALVGYANARNRMQRVVAVPGLTTGLTNGDTNANQFLGQFETGYRIDLDRPARTSITPFGRVQVGSSTQSGFNESGSTFYNLAFQSQTTTSVRTTIGADFAASFDLGGGRPLDIGVRLGWMHEFADTARPITAAFAAAPGQPFTVVGATPQRDSAVVGFSAAMPISDRASVFASYDGEVGGGTANHAARVGFRLTW